MPKNGSILNIFFSEAQDGILLSFNTMLALDRRFTEKPSKFSAKYLLSSYPIDSVTSIIGCSYFQLLHDPFHFLESSFTGTL
ncbi:hypothetical protein Dfer_0533 [Dyadobacter fermentans DSM 18053]|uniref:Uncharacterized protein n=1 Tax=Dyadobacter fermentans (strain ATCC 700827 / DSM 18053 / CIP 107007 / KCTC 52180 / NS114) TaxID=471854 RepID=C6VZI6_DYAFD|nr:hypothetical protein Dfer_0533 [Dyadobacter fermentans DSM 18053]